MCKFITLSIVFIIFEIILAFFFALIAQNYYKGINGKGERIDLKSILKGLFERVFLTVSLINNLPHALTFFSALKLGTRLKHTEPDTESNKFNDYYLIGNLCSVLFAILYQYFYLHFETLGFFQKVCH
jgi:hypothetical protein